MAIKLPNTLQDLLQTQMNREIVAALVYKQMRCDLRLQSWFGFHKFFHKSEDEELGHARDFDHYLTERGVRPIYTSVDLPKVPYSEVPIEYFRKALALEIQYTEYMNELYQKSEDEDDPNTCLFIYDKIDEQYESVASLENIIKKLERAGTDIAALQELDEKVCKIAKQR